MNAAYHEQHEHKKCHSEKKSNNVYADILCNTTNTVAEGHALGNLIHNN